MARVTEESAKSKAAKDVIKSLTAHDRLDKTEIRLSKSAVPSNVDLIKQLDSKAAKQGKKSETFSLVISSQTPLLQLKDFILSTMARKKKKRKKRKKKKRKKRKKKRKEKKNGRERKKIGKEKKKNRRERKGKRKMGKKMNF